MFVLHVLYFQTLKNQRKTNHRFFFYFSFFGVWIIPNYETKHTKYCYNMPPYITLHSIKTLYHIFILFERSNNKKEKKTQTKQIWWQTNHLHCGISFLLWVIIPSFCVRSLCFPYQCFFVMFCRHSKKKIPTQNRIKLKTHTDKTKYVTRS